MRYERGQQALWRRLPDCVLVLSPAAGELVSLDGLAAALWDVLDTPVDRSDLVDDLAAVLDGTPAQAESALDELLGELVPRGVVVVYPRDLTARVAVEGLPHDLGPFPEAPLAAPAWRALLDDTVDQRIPGLLVWSIDSGALPADARQRAEAVAEWRRSMVVALELEQLAVRLGRLLDDARIEFRVLKGPASAHLVYTDPALRSFGDLDLLVQSSDFDAAVEVLGATGCERLWPEIRPGFDRRFSKGATLQFAQGHEVDLHRTFAMGPFGLAIDPERLFAEAQWFELGTSRLPALDPKAAFVHACYHAALGDHVPRLSTMRDIAELLQPGRIDFDAALVLAAQWRGTAVVARGIDLAQTWLGLGTSLPGLRWASSQVPSRADQRRLDTYVGTNDSHTAKSLASLRMIPGIRQKAAFVYGMAFPSREFVERRGGDRAGWLRRGIRRIARGV